ncbi:MAG: alpha/beta hydrolase [Gammaproteobacteria bacterium]|nr:alpha/beta hydrolase [Gammaproteobacteria bacterium]
MLKTFIRELSKVPLALKLEQIRINRKINSRKIKMKNKTPSLYTTPSQQIAYFDQGTGPVFLFLHGFPDTPFSFQNQVDYFTEKGYRCLVPFMPGYGESSLPSNGSSSMISIAEMLDEWLIATLKEEEPIVIYGHDWGSLVAQLLTAISIERKQLPYHVEKLVISAVPPLMAFVKNMSFQQLYRSRYMAYFQLPVINKIKTDELNYIRELWQRWSPDLNYPNLHCEDTIALLKQGKSLNNGISYYRHMINPLLSLRPSAKLFRQLQLLLKSRRFPCLMISGQNDDCIGTETFTDAESCYPHSKTKHITLAGAGHFVHFEKAEEFNQFTENFLSNKKSRNNIEKLERINT